jgi:hypothetical protein
VRSSPASSAFNHADLTGAEKELIRTLFVCSNLVGSAIRRRRDRFQDQSGEADEHGDGKRNNEVAADQDAGDAAGEQGGNQPAEHPPLDRRADGDQGEFGEEAEPELAVTRGALSIARDRQHSEPHLAVSTPAIFGEPADRAPAKIVGIPASTPPGKSALIVAWIFSIAWAGLLCGLAAMSP